MHVFVQVLAELEIVLKSNVSHYVFIVVAVPPVDVLTGHHVVSVAIVQQQLGVLVPVHQLPAVAINW